MSLASVVLFVPVLVVIPPLVGAILGFVALRRIKKTGQKGRGLAIAGVVIGLLAALGGIAADVAIGYFVSHTSTYRSLDPGDCLKDPGFTVTFVHHQNCSRPHERQVFAVFDEPAPSSAPYPGTTEIRASAQDQCVARFASLPPSGDQAALGVYYLVPSRTSWVNSDNRRIICMVGNRDGSDLTGSLPGLPS